MNFVEFKGQSANSLSDLEAALNWLFASGTEVQRTIDGCFRVLERRAQVSRVDGLKIEIYPRDHEPPHFHVIGQNVNAVFAIADCALLRGEISPTALCKVQYFHLHSQAKLNEFWQNTRPTNEHFER